METQLQEPELEQLELDELELDELELDELELEQLELDELELDELELQEPELLDLRFDEPTMREPDLLVRPSAPPRRRTVDIVDLGQELNRVYRFLHGPPRAERDEDDPALVLRTASFTPGGQNGPLVEFRDERKHTMSEQDAIIRLGLGVADFYTPLGESEVVARHLNFWSDVSPLDGFPYVGLHITYWMDETESCEPSA